MTSVPRLAGCEAATAMTTTPPTSGRGSASRLGGGASGGGASASASSVGRPRGALYTMRTKWFVSREKTALYMRLTRAMTDFVVDHSGKITEGMVAFFEADTHAIVGSIKAKTALLNISREGAVSPTRANHDYTLIRNLCKRVAKTRKWEPLEHIKAPRAQKIERGGLPARIAQYKKGQRADLMPHKRGRKPKGQGIAVPDIATVARTSTMSQDHERAPQVAP